MYTKSSLQNRIFSDSLERVATWMMDVNDASSDYITKEINTNKETEACNKIDTNNTAPNKSTLKTHHGKFFIGPDKNCLCT